MCVFVIVIVFVFVFEGWQQVCLSSHLSTLATLLWLTSILSSHCCTGHTSILLAFKQIVISFQTQNISPQHDTAHERWWCDWLLILSSLLQVISLCKGLSSSWLYIQKILAIQTRISGYVARNLWLYNQELDNPQISGYIARDYWLSSYWLYSHSELSSSRQNSLKSYWLYSQIFLAI